LYAKEAGGVQGAAGEGTDLGSDHPKHVKTPKNTLQSVFSACFWSKNMVLGGFQPSRGSGREERGMEKYPCDDWSHDTYPQDKDGRKDSCRRAESTKTVSTGSPTPPLTPDRSSRILVFLVFLVPTPPRYPPLRGAHTWTIYALALSAASFRLSLSCG